MCLGSETKEASQHSSWSNRSSLSFLDSDRGLGQQEGEVPEEQEEEDLCIQTLSVVQDSI